MMGNNSLYYKNTETEKQIKKVQEEKKRKAKSNDTYKTYPSSISYGAGINIDNNFNYYEKNYPNTVYYGASTYTKTTYPYYDDSNLKSKDLKKDDYITNVNVINTSNQTICGIENIGNNCYLNSGLQILARCSSFVEKLQVFYSANYPFIALLYDAFINLLTKKEHYNPLPFVNKFCSINKEFNVGEQSCSQNFIRTVLNNVNHEIVPSNINVIKSYINYSPKDLKEKNSYNYYIKQNQILPESEALSVFSGILKSHIKGTCKKCGNSIDNYSFCYFIDQNMYLDSIFKPCYFDQVIKENISNNDAIMDCQKCDGKVKIEEKTKIAKLPEILIFTLERYLNGTNNIKVIPNEVLELKPYIDDNLSTDSTKYDLFAKNIRFGSTKKFGHEICQIKIDSKWYEFNDSTISLKKYDHDDCTYGLFYKKRKK